MKRSGWLAPEGDPGDLSLSCGWNMTVQRVPPCDPS